VPPTLASVPPAVDLGHCPAARGQYRPSQLSLPADDTDDTVLVRDLTQQVFLVLQYISLPCSAVLLDHPADLVDLGIELVTYERITRLGTQSDLLGGRRKVAVLILVTERRGPSARRWCTGVGKPSGRSFVTAPERHLISTGSRM